MRLLFTLGLLCVLAQSGCAVYQPPVAGSAKTATIDVEDPHRFPLRLAIVEIDGAKASTLSAYGLWRPPPSFIVTEGRHEFLVRYTAGTAQGHLRLWLKVEAGHYYILQSAFRGYQFTSWFIDGRTRTPVGGIVGSEE